MTTQYSAPVDFRITQRPNPETPPEIRAALEPVYAAIQEMIQTFVNNCGIGQQVPSIWSQFASEAIDQSILYNNMGRLYVTASENIAYGAVMSLHDSGGILQARNANATDNTRPIDGFCSTAAGILLGDVGECILAHGIVPVTGFTRGTRYYLSTVNGLLTAVAPVALGNIEQYAGVALSDTKFFMNVNYWIQH